MLTVFTALHSKTLYQKPGSYIAQKGYISNAGNEPLYETNSHVYTTYITR